MLKKWRSKFRRVWMPYVIAYVAKWSVRLLLRTCRIEISGLNDFINEAATSPCILMLWHNRLVLVSEILTSLAPQFIYTAFISKSRDGEPLALLAESYQCGRVLRVAHHARHQALLQMINHLKENQEVILITPDGPRGPRYVIKPGVVIAAREAKAKIVPFSWQASRCWQLKTWDKMMIPKPFSTIKVTFGSSIGIAKEEAQDLDQETNILKEALMNLEQNKSNYIEPQRHRDHRGR